MGVGPPQAKVVFMISYKSGQTYLAVGRKLGAEQAEVLLRRPKVVCPQIQFQLQHQGPVDKTEPNFKRVLQEVETARAAPGISLETKTLHWDIEMNLNLNMNLTVQGKLL